jgi:hypothetical protein
MAAAAERDAIAAGRRLGGLLAEAERTLFFGVGEAIGESPDGFAVAIQRALDAWIEVWRKAGGIQQFLPPRKVPEVRTGK